MDTSGRNISVDEEIKVLKLKVKPGTMLYDGRILLIYEPVKPKDDEPKQKKLKSTEVGVVKKILVKEGDIVTPGSVIVELEKKCNHPTVIKDLCAECGADLQKELEKEGGQVSQASVSMVHMVPELKVNEELAQILGKADMDRLLEHKKLVLLVDLDQTLIHTTNDNIPNNIKDVYHFQLYGPRSPWYHTRLRPGTHKFLQGVSEKYELHICTFGSRRYAHTIARFLDPDGKFFSHRILSRDECFDPNSKTANLRALFPCGENMVCIIDDREDVWDYASNLIHVKPYHFFQHTGDIHAPPGLTKCENDDNKQGYDFTQINENQNNEITTFDYEESENKDDELPDVSVVVDGEGIDETKYASEEGSDGVNEAEEVADKVQASDEVTDKEKETPQEGPNKEKETSKEAADEAKDTSEEVTDEAKNASKEVVDAAKEAPKTPSIEFNADHNAPSNGELNTRIKVEENPSTDVSNPDDKCVENDSKGDGNCEQKSIPNEESDTNQVEAEETDIAKVETKIENARSSEDRSASRTQNGSRIDSPVDPNSNLVQKAIPADNGWVIIEEADDYLLYLEEILKTIHGEFFKRYEETKIIPDLKIVVPETRAKVLEGVSIVFSGIVPNRIKLEDSQAYKIARSLGAKVTQNIEPDTTHLVALRAGTAKVHAAYKRKNLKLVTPEWLWLCAERWEKVDERMFPLKNAKPNTESRHPPAHCRSPEHPEPLPMPYQITNNVNSNQVGGFLYTINPLMSLSSEDIETMEGEVEDMFKESDGELEGAEDAFTLNDEEDQKEQMNVDISRKRKLDDGSSSSSAEDEERFEKFIKPKKRKKLRKTEDEFDLKKMLEEEPKNEEDDEDEDDDDDEEKEDDDTDDDETINSKFRRGENLPSDLDIDYNTEEGTEEDQESDGEWNVMGAALEREFLEGE